MAQHRHDVLLRTLLALLHQPLLHPGVFHAGRYRAIGDRFTQRLERLYDRGADFGFGAKSRLVECRLKQFLRIGDKSRAFPLHPAVRNVGRHRGGTKRRLTRCRAGSGYGRMTAT